MSVFIRTFAAALAGGLTLAGAASAFDTETVNGDKPLAGFESIYIAPVATDIAEPRDRRDRPVRDKDAASLAEDFHKDLVRAFSKSFTVADGPGAGVLSIEPTLTRLESTRPTMADYSDQPGLSPQSVYAGGAKFQAVLSEDGAVLAEIGDRYTSTFGDGQPRIGIWQDAGRAFNMWSRQLVDFVEEN